MHAFAYDYTTITYKLFVLDWNTWDHDYLQIVGIRLKYLGHWLLTNCRY